VGSLTSPCLKAKGFYAQNIKRVRESKKMTQKEFAGLLGITAIHYCAIENGRKEVTIKLLKKVAEITKMQLVITLIDK